MIDIKETKLKMIVEVIEEYLEKARIVTNANDHKRIKKNKPNPIPRTLGPSSTLMNSSGFAFGSISFSSSQHSGTLSLKALHWLQINILATFSYLHLVFSDLKDNAADSVNVNLLVHHNNTFASLVYLFVLR